MLRFLQYRVQTLPSAGPKRRVGPLVRILASPRVGSGSCSTRPWCGRPSIRQAKKRDAETECLGRSRGGIGTKIHACVGALGNAVRLITTPGQAGDSPQALSLLADLAPDQVLADTAYDSDATGACCTEKGIKAVIPSHPGRTEARPMDEEAYRDRNKVERFFDRLKQYRRLARATKKRSSPSSPSGMLM